MGKKSQYKDALALSKGPSLLGHFLAYSPLRSHGMCLCLREEGKGLHLRVTVP